MCFTWIKLKRKSQQNSLIESWKFRKVSETFWPIDRPKYFFTLWLFYVFKNVELNLNIKIYKTFELLWWFDGLDFKRTKSIGIAVKDIKLFNSFQRTQLARFFCSSSTISFCRENLFIHWIVCVCVCAKNLNIKPAAY